MIMIKLIVMLALCSVSQSDNQNYWDGYASSIYAKQVIKNSDIIHEGKPKPKVEIPTPKLELKNPLAIPMYRPTDYRGALKYAKNNKCKILAVFSRKSCGGCIDLKKNTLADVAVLAQLKIDNIGLIQEVDCNTEKDIADYLHIQYLPYYIVTDSNKIIKEGYGYLPPNEFINWLKK